MKLSSKFRFVIISALCAAALTSCKDSTDDLLSLSESEVYNLQNPTVKVKPTSVGSSVSAQVEIEFASPTVDLFTDGRPLEYDRNGQRRESPISKTPTKYVYDLSQLGLFIGQEYPIKFDNNNKITYTLKDNIRYTTTVNLPPVKLDFETIYSSPIAVRNGLDNGWTGENWISVADAGSQECGGVGYAATNLTHLATNSPQTKWQWLFSPRVYLEAGEVYTFYYYGRRPASTQYYVPKVEIYISQFNEPEDLYNSDPISSSNSSYNLYQTYDKRNGVFSPKTSGYYYGALCFYQGENPLLTGFEVKKAKL